MIPPEIDPTQRQSRLATFSIAHMVSPRVARKWMLVAVVCALIAAVSYALMTRAATQPLEWSLIDTEGRTLRVRWSAHGRCVDLSAVDAVVKETRQAVALEVRAPDRCYWRRHFRLLRQPALEAPVLASGELSVTLAEPLGLRDLVRGGG